MVTVQEAAAVYAAVSTAIVLGLKYLIQIVQRIYDRNRLLKYGFVPGRRTNRFMELITGKSPGRQGHAVRVVALIYLLILAARILYPDLIPLAIKEELCDSVKRARKVYGLVKQTDGRSNLGPVASFSGVAFGYIRRAYLAGATLPIHAGNVSDHPDFIPVDGTSKLGWKFHKARTIGHFKVNATIWADSDRAYSGSEFKFNYVEGRGPSLEEDENFVQSFDDVSRTISWPRYAFQKITGDRNDVMRLAIFNQHGRKTTLKEGFNKLGVMQMSMFEVNITRNTELGYAMHFFISCLNAGVEFFTRDDEMLTLIDASSSAYVLGVALASPLNKARGEFLVYKRCATYLPGLIVQLLVLVVVLAGTVALKFYYLRDKNRILSHINTEQGVWDLVAKDILSRKDCAQHGGHESVPGFAISEHANPSGMQHLGFLALGDPRIVPRDPGKILL